MEALQTPEAREKAAQARSLAKNVDELVSAGLPGVSEARKAAILHRARQMPESSRRTYVRACAGSRTAAIKAQCMECLGWSRSDVRQCTALACPLWPVRPYQT